MAFAHRLADKAGAVILPHFRTGCAVDHKGGDDFDPVTAADRDAEAAIRRALAEAYPDHGIIGEEFGDTHPEAEYCWVIDPIDGTRAFIIGQPLWGTLIGLTIDGKPTLGMMDQPYTHERFFADDKGSFFRRDGDTKTMQVRACASLGDALLASTTPDMFIGSGGDESFSYVSNDGERFGRLSAAVRLRRFGGDCYNYCLLALGYVDLVVEAGLKPFDILPLIPIVERAGGVVTTWEGGDPRDGGHILAAGDSRIHVEAIKILSG
jgi:histidinol phosphatase-like enzyme (inositol monophosphatase family)